MKYIIVNDEATLTSLGAGDQTLMFPQNGVLGFETINDTTIALSTSSGKDIDDGDVMIIEHEDTSAAATHKAQRNIIDAAVSAINCDSRRGWTVLFDRLNDVKLEGQVLTNSTVTED